MYYGVVGGGLVQQIVHCGIAIFTHSFFCCQCQTCSYGIAACAFLLYHASACLDFDVAIQDFLAFLLMNSNLLGGGVVISALCPGMLTVWVSPIYHCNLLPLEYACSREKLIGVHSPSLKDSLSFGCLSLCPSFGYNVLLFYQINIYLHYKGETLNPLKYLNAPTTGPTYPKISMEDSSTTPKMVMDR